MRLLHRQRRQWYWIHLKICQTLVLLLEMGSSPVWICELDFFFLNLYQNDLSLLCLLLSKIPPSHHDWPCCPNQLSLIVDFWVPESGSLSWSVKSSTTCSINTIGRRTGSRCGPGRLCFSSHMLHPKTKLHIAQYVKCVSRLINTSSCLNTRGERWPVCHLLPCLLQWLIYLHFSRPLPLL